MPGKTGNVSASDQRAALMQQNMNARRAVVGSSINMLQQVFTQTITSGIAGSVFNIALRNVGLVKRFYVRVDATVARSAAETQTRVQFGPAQLISNLTLTDLSNQQRINTTGWHLHMIASAKRGRAFGAALTNDQPLAIGANFTVMSAPSSFTSGNQALRFWWEVPVTYSDTDLRGAIYASTVNATWQMQVTINASFFVTSTADKTLAGYQSSGTDLGTFSSLTLTVYQNYLDQLPQGGKGPILPLVDLSTAYLLNNTVKSSITASQDNPVPYANFREFQSTCVIYDQNGTLAAGTDVTSWALESANYTNLFKIDAILAALMTRNVIGDDFPNGVYYFDHRAQPINTVQYGNMQLVLNPSTAAASSQLLIGYESLSIINQITQAGSLYGNN